MSEEKVENSFKNAGMATKAIHYAQGKLFSLNGLKK